MLIMLRWFRLKGLWSTYYHKQYAPEQSLCNTQTRKYNMNLPHLRLNKILQGKCNRGHKALYCCTLNILLANGLIFRKWVNFSEQAKTSTNNQPTWRNDSHSTGVIHNHRVGQNRIYTSYTTVSLVNSLPKMPYINRIYMVPANPTHSTTGVMHIY
jgi:hypothetical protein